MTILIISSWTIRYIIYINIAPRDSSWITILSLIRVACDIIHSNTSLNCLTETILTTLIITIWTIILIACFSIIFRETIISTLIWIWINWAHTVAIICEIPSRRQINTKTSIISCAKNRWIIKVFIKFAKVVWLFVASLSIIN